MGVLEVAALRRGNHEITTEHSDVIAHGSLQVSALEDLLILERRAGSLRQRPVGHVVEHSRSPARAFFQMLGGGSVASASGTDYLDSRVLMTTEPDGFPERGGPRPASLGQSRDRGGSLPCERCARSALCKSPPPTRVEQRPPDA